MDLQLESHRAHDLCYPDVTGVIGSKIFPKLKCQYTRPEGQATNGSWTVSSRKGIRCANLSTLHMDTCLHAKLISPVHIHLSLTGLRQCRSHLAVPCAGPKEGVTCCCVSNTGNKNLSIDDCP